VGKQSSQKFIQKNRAPRVQIEYDVETKNGQQKVEIPFVMGVLSDLSGRSAVDLPPVENRTASEIDPDNFDSRMQAMKPRVTFSVPNKITGEGSLPVDITFESIDDFSPAAIAKKVEPLKKLLEARTQLSNLATFMDGKPDAENLISSVIQDPELLKQLVESAQAANKPDSQ
jgi:type VI secretion system protein ImpB